ncbi:MAG: DMT family transporter [Proteobacteria bacterium]|nr:DMT family transporter [Pseudomonadota bacterium]
MTSRKPIDTKAAALMVVLCMIWGMQQVALKAAAPAMAPVLQVAVRSGAAAILIAILILLRRETAQLGGGTWRPGLLVGVLFAVEFLFVGEGLRFTSASHMAIFLYTAPVFAALGLHLRLPEERLTPLQWVGIATAFAGIVVSFAGRGAASDGGASWIGDLLGIAAGAMWGATTLTIRFSRLSRTPATVTLLYQLVGAFVLLIAAAILLGQTDVTYMPVLAASLAFQIVLVSFLSFLAWFALLRTYLASRLGVLSFMSPVFGISFGVAILGEALDTAFIIGAVLVLAGILLVSGRDLFNARKTAR